MQANSTNPIYKPNLDKLNTKNTFIIVGRAHSGTRLLPEAMEKAGIFMGKPLNIAHDLLPVENIYKACRIIGEYVKYKGNFEWDFSAVHKAKIPDEFIKLMGAYLKPLIDYDSEFVGWKIPNNNLIYPWLVRLLPQATYLIWHRHPEGSCKKMTGVDRLEKWNIPCKKFIFHEWNFKMRAVSWKYHFDIISNTPIPENYLSVRFEDYVLNSKNTRQAIEQFINLKLPVDDINASKARPLNKNFRRRFPFLQPAMDNLDYQ